MRISNHQYILSIASLHMMNVISLISTMHSKQARHVLHGRGAGAICSHEATDRTVCSATLCYAMLLSVVAPQLTSYITVVHLFSASSISRCIATQACTAHRITNQFDDTCITTRGSNPYMHGHIERERKRKGARERERVRKEKKQETEAQRELDSLRKGGRGTCESLRWGRKRLRSESRAVGRCWKQGKPASSMPPTTACSQTNNRQQQTSRQRTGSREQTTETRDQRPETRQQT